MENKQSFQAKVEKGNRRLNRMVFIVISVFCIISYWNFACYNRIFEGYNDLQQYYEYTKKSADDMKKYLTSGEESYLFEHENSMRKAKDKIEDILTNPIMESKWRFQLLKNMLEEYELSAQALMEQYLKNEHIGDYREYYELFVKNESFIQETSTDYYHIVTDTMNKRKASINFAQTMTYIMIIAVSLTILFWTHYFSHLFYHTISQPLQKVLENISLIKQGKYDLEMESQSSLEMEELCVALEEMAGKIALNMETQKEKAELEKKLAQSELKMLQNQINPHFLFNTLNTVYCMAEQEGAFDASDMLLKTSHLLRYSLEMQNRLSDFAREIHALQYYIEIQKIRFADKIEFHIEVVDEKAIANLPIPAMILQPLVENAIQHGLKDCVKDGRVDIRIEKQKEGFRIKVSDNGQGMEKEALERLIENDYHHEDGEGLGLYNVVHRMKMYYEECRVTLRSARGEGFEVILEVNA